MKGTSGLSKRLVFGLAASALAVLGSHRAGAQPGPILPPGFKADVYLAGLNRPTAMTFGPDKRLYVSQQNGQILAIGNHRVVKVASGFDTPLGLGWNRRLLYVSSMGRISRLTPSANFKRFSRRDVVTGLPFGRHQNDGLAFRSGWMYVGVGSTCDACVEKDPRSATIMRFYLNGSHGQIFARGLRNPYGLAFRPGTRQLYATDNGRDDHDDQVPDELNLIQQGKDYGFPSCWGNGGGKGCRGTVPPAALLEPHASADGLTFYAGRTFPARYRGDAFIAEWGDSENQEGYGHKVVVVHFTAHGTSVSNFATGLEHPLAVVGARDGSLLIADYGTGVIWHVRV